MTIPASLLHINGCHERAIDLRSSSRGIMSQGDGLSCRQATYPGDDGSLRHTCLVQGDSNESDDTYPFFRAL